MQYTHASRRRNIKNILQQGIIAVKKERYLGLIIIIAPLLNFLSGINIDLYAPSLPAIGHYFDTTMAIAKNTVSITLAGFAIGSLVFGTLLDIFGRRRLILFCLFIYILASLSALLCQTITHLMIVRFIQGMMMATISMGPRALLVDHFSGHRLTIALLYTSLSYGLGPIIGPFLGGFIQYHFGWQANFLIYALCAASLGFTFLLFVNESLVQRQPFCLKTTCRNYLMVLRHKYFMAGTLIVTGVQVQQLLYPTLGPFLLEIKLGKTPITYGNTALLIGMAYLIGTLMNRFLVKKLAQNTLICIGLTLSALGLFLLLGFDLFIGLKVWTIVLPFIITILGGGFLYANILGQCLKFFPKNVGAAAAIFTCTLVLTASIILFIISQFSIHSLSDIVVILGFIWLAQIMLYLISRPLLRN